MARTPEKPILSRHLVWLRADLRATDNTALLAACKESNTDVACVYTITPQQWKKHDVAAVRIDFELRTLSALKNSLEKLNIPLFILTANSFNDLPKALSVLAIKHKISAIYANRQYEFNEISRDNAVALELEKNSISFSLYHDQCAVPPGTISKGDGGSYTIFTPFKKKWLERLETSGIQPQPSPKKRKNKFADSDNIPASVEGFISHVNKKISLEWWPAGETAALKRLSTFAENNLKHYLDNRDMPAVDGVSQLSPYLAVGAISPRQCLNAAFNHRRIHGESAGGNQWITEIGWRDFYKHVMVAWPRVCKHRSFKPETDSICWRHDKKEFQLWCEGRTGFPLVDAAMRQLQETGWMHNRLRMVVAMFLSKDLFIDWRWGEKFFMQHLIDGDLSANNGGWQWSASTGNDAAPYFRIFNPVSQSVKCDPQGHFIRTYLPELRDVPTTAIHEPHKNAQASLLDDSLHSKYPTPMIDHRMARERVLSHFKAARSLKVST